MFHLHRWGKWTPARHYTDGSFGGSALSTMLVRHCPRCGLAQSKGLYGVVLPLRIPPAKGEQ